MAYRPILTTDKNTVTLYRSFQTARVSHFTASPLSIEVVALRLTRGGSRVTITLQLKPPFITNSKHICLKLLFRHNFSAFPCSNYESCLNLGLNLQEYRCYRSVTITITVQILMNLHLIHYHQILACLRYYILIYHRQIIINISN